MCLRGATEITGDRMGGLLRKSWWNNLVVVLSALKVPLHMRYQKVTFSEETFEMGLQTERSQNRQPAEETVSGKCLVGFGIPWSFLWYGEQKSPYLRWCIWDGRQKIRCQKNWQAEDTACGKKYCGGIGRCESLSQYEKPKCPSFWWSISHGSVDSVYIYIYIYIYTYIYLYIVYIHIYMSGKLRRQLVVRVWWWCWPYESHLIEGKKRCKNRWWTEEEAWENLVESSGSCDGPS